MAPCPWAAAAPSSMSDPTDSMTLVAAGDPARRRMAQYELWREVGSGAVGTVWQARDLDLGRWAAVKLLQVHGHAGDDPFRVERFFREARSAAQLTHPNVAQVYQVGTVDGQPFIAMEWLDGTDLSAWVREHGAMPWHEALAAIGDAAAALAAAHGAGLVHRDIKPSNLVRLRSGQVKVVDFGLARPLAGVGQLTQTGALVGTPAYLSPEMCEGGDATPASDLYALGCTLVHLLTGSPPFKSAHVAEMVHHHVYRPMPDPAERVPGLPAAVSTIVARATAKSPSERYGRAQALLADVHAALDGQGVTSTGSSVGLLSLDPSRTVPEELPAAGGPGNLPQELSSFVGRRLLIAQAWGQLGKGRLLTLCGPGGTGKTRLALRLARLAASRHADGAWWADLAALRATDPVLGPLAQALEVGDADGKDLLTALVDHCRPRRLLLVLDNCEHLLVALAPAVSRLLSAAPGLRVLATSRQPLGVPGELVLPVQPMQLCDAAARETEWAGNEAVELFVERARAVRPDFTPDLESLAAVVSICRRLDGIPLAIELAAARTRVLSPPRIAERLGDLFRLLTGGQRTLLPRQQTLRALIDWSYQLLDDAQRRCLASLAIFQGEFDLAAAEAVLPPQTAGTGAVLDELEALVERSLLVASDRGGDMGFRLLETIRQYALERLAEDPDLAAHLRSRHRAYYTQAYTQQVEALDGPGQRQAVSAMDRLRDNVRAAYDGALAHGEHAPAIELATALARHDQRRGLMAEGIERTLRLLAADPPPSLALAQLLEGAATLGLRFGRSDLARDWCERGLHVAASLGDERLRGTLLRQLGNLAYRSEDFARALELYQQALQVARGAGHVLAQAHALVNIAAVATEQLRPRDGQAALLDALDIYRASGHSRGQASVLGNLGVIEHDLGLTEASRQHFAAAIELHESNGEARGAAIARCQHGACLLALDDAAAARQVLEPAVEALRQREDRPTLAAALEWLARACARLREPERAWALARESLSIRRSAVGRNDLGDSLELFAELLLERDPALASRLIGAAYALRQGLGITLQARDQVDLQALRDRCSERLGEAEFARLHELGADQGADCCLAAIDASTAV